MALRLFILILIIGALSGGIFGLKWQQMQKQQAAGPSGPPPAVIATVQVTQQDWQPRLSAAGSLVASQGIYITNEVAGTIREILFESGQTVNQGDQLIQLDDSVDRADLQGLFAQRDLARIKLDRFARLIHRHLFEAVDQVHRLVEVVQYHLLAQSSGQARAPIISLDRDIWLR